MAPRTDRAHVDVVTAIAVVLAVIGGLSIVVVVVAGLSSATPSPVLTWIGMIALPIAFILMAVQFVRMIRRRAA